MNRDFMGELVATRSVLENALQYLSIEQLRILHDIQTGTVTDLTQLWEPRGSLSEFQSQFLSEAKRICSRIEQRIHAIEAGNIGTGVASGNLNLYCIKCDMPVPFLGFGAATTCPTCGSDEFLEALR